MRMDVCTKYFPHTLCMGLNNFYVTKRKATQTPTRRRRRRKKIVLKRKTVEEKKNGMERDVRKRMGKREIYIYQINIHIYLWVYLNFFWRRKRKKKKRQKRKEKISIFNGVERKVKGGGEKYLLGIKNMHVLYVHTCTYNMHVSYNMY